MFPYIRMFENEKCYVLYIMYNAVDNLINYCDLFSYIDGYLISQ